MKTNKINDLQEIWQDYNPANYLAHDPDRIKKSILHSVKKTSKKILIQNIGKSLAIGFLLMGFIFLFYTIDIRTFYGFIGAGIILFSPLLMLIVYWNIRFASAKLNWSLPQDDFISHVLLKVKNHHIQFKKLFKWFVLVLIAGINLLYLEILSSLNLHERIGIHLGITFLLVYYILSV